MTSLRQVNPLVRSIRTLTASITRDMSQGAQHRFQETLDVSSGDPQGAGLVPITFVRQVLAVCLYPQLLQDPRLPPDVGLRARRLLAGCEGGSVGSYSESSGIPVIRRSVVGFISRRDGGVPSYIEDIFISCGSQIGLMLMMKLLASGDDEVPTGVLTPLPCPQTLHMLLDITGVTAVPYQLREGLGWAVEPEELGRVLEAARGRCRPRAIYISNPGNPTGHVQDRKSIEAIIRFAAARGLLLLVDEVYQDSVHGPGIEFVSYKRVLFEMGEGFSEKVEMVSFHSMSNSTIGECGLRAGYMEAVNMDPHVKQCLDTMLCTGISTPVIGQLALDVMVDPPRPGDPSFEAYTQEVALRRTTLSQNARRAQEVLDSLPGISCRPTEGGIYLFPRLQLPAEILEQAKIQEVAADVLYCRRLLEEEGVLVGAGCEHGEIPGRFHLRFCVLVPAGTLEEALTRLGAFQNRLHQPRSTGPTRLTDCN